MILLPPLAFALALAVSARGATLPEKRAMCLNGLQLHEVAHASCCKWFDVLNDIQTNLFHGGKCGADAHESIRLVFHDAIARSSLLESLGVFGGGGADGSVLTFAANETMYPANLGTADIVHAQIPFATNHGVSTGDFVAFAGAVALANCPGAPQPAFLAGRPPPTQAAPDNLVPEPFHTVDQMLERIADAGNFTAADLTAMLAAHTVAAADDVEDDNPGLPFDSSPGVFDAQLFVEVQLHGVQFPGPGNRVGEVMAPMPGELRLQSDSLVARDPRTACDWQSFVGNQAKLRADFADVFRRLTLLGQDASTLVDCSDVIPRAKASPNTGKPFSYFPAGKGMADVEQACAATPFPSLVTLPGPEQSVPPVPLNS
ncbi:lignin peroxidase precursor [Phanerochaete sordida]|uniref:Peroxidase n=1 Tax=Phanerochaete sordida TaxID=48140 RepID=A0A9P3GHT1_9APHY|nr:lignin peroxidase precursor [Phanerochaete sordida]